MLSKETVSFRIGKFSEHLKSNHWKQTCQFIQGAVSAGLRQIKSRVSDFEILDAIVTGVTIMVGLIVFLMLHLSLVF